MKYNISHLDIHFPNISDFVHFFSPFFFVIVLDSADQLIFI